MKAFFASNTPPVATKVAKVARVTWGVGVRVGWSVVWCGVVGCGVVWCSVVWCGFV